ncbi:DUF882 domain-containing protein [Xanthobacter sp. TB0139]|uniref:DUF882 domain-containing protein n=1 Tax=Xanthobacter sp. TB0139 TaxID=3459178 RepID=UPI00403987B0
MNPRFATLANTIAPHPVSAPLRGLRTLLPRSGASALRTCLMGAALLVGGTSGLQNAVANGDTRTLSFKHMHHGEQATFTFKKNGRYDSAVLKQINWFMRDWRNDKQIRMDPQLFDILWEVNRETGGKSAIHVLSSYRSPETNSMLRRRSKGVAKFSQHTRGKALDFYIPGVKLADLRAAGLRLQRGGVGFYPTSGSPFVHMDTGGVRHWPRMSRAQLYRVFPDGKTVHVPSDGKPLPGYQTAEAEIERRKAGGGSTPSKPKNFFAALFGGGQDEADDNAQAAPSPAPARRQVAQASGTRMSQYQELTATPEPKPAAATRGNTTLAAAPLPLSRPSMGNPHVPTPDNPQRLALASEPIMNADAPMPLHRPRELSAPLRVAQLERAPLPSVITRGSSEAVPEQEETMALGYAAPGDIFGPAPQRVASAAPARKTTQNRRSKPAQAKAAQNKAEKIAFGPIFLSPRLSNQLISRPPEVRVFTAFVSAPQEVVAGKFSHDPSYGLRPSFSGEAVAYVPTHRFPQTTLAMSTAK